LGGNRLNRTEAIAETQEEPVVEAAAPEVESVTDQDKKESIATPAKGSWREIIDRISYKGIVKNMPYLMFLTVLCILYITNNNRAISLTRSINEKTKELKELRWKYMDIQSRLMYQTSETQMINRSAALGLKPLDRPAFEVKVKVPAAKED